MQSKVPVANTKTCKMLSKVAEEKSADDLSESQSSDDELRPSTDPRQVILGWKSI